MEGSVCPGNPDEWGVWCFISPSLGWYKSLLRPGANGWDFGHCLWFVMEIEEKKLDKEMWRSWAIWIKSYNMDLYAFNCLPKLPKRNWPMLGISQIMCIEVGETLWGIEAFGCKIIIHRYDILAVTIDCMCFSTIVEYPMTFSTCLSCVSTEFLRC